MKLTRFLLVFSLLLLAVQLALAQYFGQNKPRYHELDFKVLETPTFDVHYYVKNRPALERFANDAENWYELHKAVLQDSFARSPILIYNDHADFQMTNAVFGQISTGTGGVTEGFKTRLIMPFTFTNEQNHHVLGHEMAHVFQYNMVARLQGGTRALSNIPLWMIEGLAEYLSLGKVDAHTAMWMRDAVINSDVPSIRDLNSYKYFPYRYGHAFWAYLTGTYGDQIIQPFFMSTAQYGLDGAVQQLLGKSREKVSEEFGDALRNHYEPMMGGLKEKFIGRRILSEENSGRLNVSPSMSPNGRYLIFHSEKDVFNTDLYLATASGKILKKLTKITRDGHLDDLSFLESAGTWSRDSKKFAFVAFKKGVNVIVIKEVETGKTTDVIPIPGVPAISNPAWSPNGRDIVFSGLVEGQVDLYSYNLRSGRVKQLTDDPYAEIQPNFNEAGTHIVYATDKLSMQEGRTNGKFKMNIAVYDLETERSGQIRVFAGADNLNPSFDHEDNIVFLSDRDGFRNIYKYNNNSGKVIQMTDVKTGISGITKYSPAISVSRKRDRIVFTHYYRGDYQIHQSTAARMLSIPVDKDDVNLAAAYLPVQNDSVPQIVQSNLEKLDLLPDTDLFKDEEYRPKFTLDHFSGSAGVGVGTGNFGTRAGLAGGIEMFFSDIAGNNQLFATIAANGEFFDFGGQLTYLNRKHRIAYGASISHIPQRTGYVLYGEDTVNFQGQEFPVFVEEVNVLRIFEETFSLIGELPLSKHTRVEANVGATYQWFRQDATPYYYDQQTGFYIGQGDRERVPLNVDEIFIGNYAAREGVYYTSNVAYVGDNAKFGLTGPMDGYRYRVEVSKTFGNYDFISTGIDVRAYKYIGPFSIAGRFQHGARYGEDANNFNPIFLGWQGFVRGYSYNQIEKLVGINGNSNDQVTFRSDLNVALERTSGSKYFVSGFEVRLPFTGPEQLAVIPTSFLVSDLSFFYDIGVAFDEWSHLSDGEPAIIQRPLPGGGIENELVFLKPKVAMSAGLSLRVNLFGAMILEPYMAYPLQKDSQFLFGFNFIPGW